MAEAREAISLNLFRKNISVEIVNPLPYYAFGKGFINIIHTIYTCNIIHCETQVYTSLRSL